MKIILALTLAACLAACGNNRQISAQTESSLVNGHGAANTGVLNGEHMPSPGGG
jgi:hypothetical protein